MKPWPSLDALRDRCAESPDRDIAASAAGRDAGAAPAHGRRARRLLARLGLDRHGARCLALDVAVRHRWLLVAFTLGAAAAKHSAMVVPWQDWLAERRGRLCSISGAEADRIRRTARGRRRLSFALLLFLANPVHRSRARSAGGAASGSRSVWERAQSQPRFCRCRRARRRMRIVLVAAVATAAFLLTRTLRREPRRTSGPTRARSTSERSRRRRITGSRTTCRQSPISCCSVGRRGTTVRRSTTRRAHPDRSRLSTGAHGDRRHVDGGALLRCIAESAPVQVAVEADPTAFDAATAQKSASSPTSCSRTPSSTALFRSS